MAERLREFFNKMIKAEIDISAWLVEGRTCVIFKGWDPKDAANYRPIACLNTAYKAMTAVLSQALNGCVINNNILPLKQ